VKEFFVTWQPYQGLRVLDVSQGFAGPYCASILAAGGAEVIKVEPPAGDWSRLMGHAHDGHSPMSIVGNIGKRAICVDLTKPQGLAVVKRMALSCDVFIQSFRPGVADKLGIGAEAILSANPRTIYLSISGFGADGPYAKRAGSDSVMQAYTGMMVMNRDERDTPRRIGMLVIDALSGPYAAHVIGAALYHRAQTGTGGSYSLSLLEVCAAFQSVPIVDASLHGETQASVSVPAGTFATADGHLNLVAIRNEMFFSICRAIGKDEWITDARFATNELRRQHQLEINSGIAEVLALESTSHWQKVFDKHDVLCSVVNDYAQFLVDPQVQHAKIFSAVNQPPVGTVPIATVPGFSAPANDMGHAPAIGQHTRELLIEYGYGNEEIEKLCADGAVVDN
jgi:crotonobetainyl-CoA:carnitine CoA-transferase CaiB-like acyl-CoA transferase